MILATLLLAAALPGTQPLTRQGDLALQMVEGIDKYLARRLASDQPTAPPDRLRFRHIIGLADARVAPDLLRLRQLTQTPRYTVHAVRWQVFENVDADGLLLEPAVPPTCYTVALPDADQSPEQTAQLYAARLAENGCLVLIPTLIDRRDDFSGNPALNRLTNQPHREYIYRMAYQAGRHIIGYEVQKVLAAVDWFQRQNKALPISVTGYGEGGLVAFYAAAADERIHTAVVSGYFRNRRNLHNEPIYRNVWGLLPNFGDAEIARLIAPRRLIVEAQRHPAVSGPPPERPGRAGAAPGAIDTPAIDEVRTEVRRAGTPITLIESPGEATLKALLNRDPIPAGPAPQLPTIDRMERQFRQLTAFTQQTVRNAERARKAYWANANLATPQSWAQTRAFYDDQFRAEIIGRLPRPAGAPQPETRLLYDTHLFEGHEVYIPVFDEVFSYGILLVPKGIKPGERRPLVIAQHGLEGRPQEIIQPTIPGEMRTYQRFAARLAERGFVVFAPQNPYIHGAKFRQLCRKGDPLQIGLFAFIAAQYARSIDWLETLPFVDKDRIGFYGLSYGGATAVRIPAVEPRIKAVVCSGNFNEWSWKITTDEQPFSYQFTREYEIYEFNQTNTFGHAEMATLIAPRPFFVERGHADGVGIDEWVSYEFAKVRRLFANWQLGDRTEIEYFNGIHQIWGHGAFAFLHRHLQWP